MSRTWSSYLSCRSRNVPCKYERIGCPWRGPFHERQAHESTCAHPRKSGDDIMEALQVIDTERQAEMRLFQNIFSLLSFEKIAFSGRYSTNPALISALCTNPGSGELGGHATSTLQMTLTAWCWWWGSCGNPYPLWLCITKIMGPLLNKQYGGRVKLYHILGLLVLEWQRTKDLTSLYCAVHVQFKRCLFIH